MPRSEPHFSGSVNSVQKGIYNCNGVRIWTVLNKWQDEGEEAYSNGKKRTQFTNFSILLHRWSAQYWPVYINKTGQTVSRKWGTGSWVYVQSWVQVYRSSTNIRVASKGHEWTGCQMTNRPTWPTLLFSTVLPYTCEIRCATILYILCYTVLYEEGKGATKLSMWGLLT